MHPIIAQIIRAELHAFEGRLGGDPEIRYFEGGKSVVTFRIAVNQPGAKRDDGKEPDWFKVEAWNELATEMADALKKGDLVEVTGRVKTETYKNRQGEDVTSLCISVKRWSPGVPKPPTAPAPTTKPATPATWVTNDTGPASDEEVPF
jgi:single-strand DNA-binding protein